MDSPEIALLTESLDPARGGAERAVRALAETLAAKGRRVAVYTPASRAGPELSMGDRIPVQIPKRPRALWALKAARAIPAAARADGAGHLIACGKLVGADSYWPHGGVHAAAREASANAGREGMRRVAARLGRRARGVEWSYDAIERRAFAECRSGQARAVALSDRVRLDMVRLHGLDAASIRVVRNGVNPSRFYPADLEGRASAQAWLTQRAKAERDAPVALFCGHAFRLKGLDVAIRALANVPSVHLAVAGGGDPRPYVELAAQHGLADRLTFMGRVEDMPLAYRGASFLLHPSRYDPCSLVVTEALACGLPVIASSNDGASEFVHQGANGYRVLDCEDVDRFSEFASLLADPKLRAELASGAAEFKRSWEDVGHELIDAVIQ